MPIFYLIEFRLAKGKKKGTTGVPSRFWGQKFLKTGLNFFAWKASARGGAAPAVLSLSPVSLDARHREAASRLSERHELEKPERLDGVGLFTVLDLELK